MAGKESTGNVTIRDLAKELGLTHATVSRALNDHPQTNAGTKVRVRALAAARGYVPNAAARSMRHQTSSLFGLVVPDIENPFYGTVAKAMAKALSAAGMQLMLAISEDDPAVEHREVLALRSARVAGIAVTLTAHPLPATLSLLKAVRAVQLIRYVRGGPRPCVLMNDAQGVKEALLHLLDLGHRDIAYIGAVLDLSTGAARFQGYQSALAQRRIRVRETLVKFGPPKPAFGRDALLGLMNLPKPPTAVFMASPQLTLGALVAANEMKIRLPEGISLVSYGDAEWFLATQPAVTAMRLPIEDTAQAATNFLTAASRPESNGVRDSIVFDPELVLRGTTMARKK